MTNIQGYAELMRLPIQHPGSYELLGGWVEPIQPTEGITPETKQRIFSQVGDAHEADDLVSHISSSNAAQNARVAGEVNTASVIVSQLATGLAIGASIKVATKDNGLAGFYGIVGGVIVGMISSKAVEIPARIVSDLYLKKKQAFDAKRFLDCELGTK